MVSPCISLLRSIALQVNQHFGAHLGTKHSTPDLTRDLTTISDSMRATGVFCQKPGRVLRGVKKGEVPNTITAGIQQLAGPLADYNRTFARLQRRLRQTPLAPIDPTPSDAAASGVQPPPATPRGLVAPLSAGVRAECFAISTHAHRDDSSQTVTLPRRVYPRHRRFPLTP